MMKSVAWKCAIAIAFATFGMLANAKCARADDFHFYAGLPYHIAGPVYGYSPYVAAPPVYAYGYTAYAAPAPLVSYGYVAGPPVWHMNVPYPAYYYPESIGWYGGYYPAEVKYKFRHGYVKVEIED